MIFTIGLKIRKFLKMENIFAKTTQNILRVVKDKFEKEKYKNVRIWFAPPSYLEEWKEQVDYMYSYEEIFKDVNFQEIDSNLHEAIRKCLNNFTSSLNTQNMYIDNGKHEKNFIENHGKIKFFYFNIVKA